MCSERVGKGRFYMKAHLFTMPRSIDYASIGYLVYDPFEEAGINRGQAECSCRANLKRLWERNDYRLSVSVAGFGELTETSPLAVTNSS
jgi:hypothetical protein